MVAVSTNVPTPIVRCLRDDDAFDALAESWRLLATEIQSVPFLHFDWLRSSWRHFQSADSSLFILTVHDADEKLIGLAPWYRKRLPWSGEVLRSIGSDEACSDYMSLLTVPARETEVVCQIAAWLCGEGAGQWDLIELDGIDADNRTIGRLLGDMKQHGHTVHTRSGQSCWRIALPDDWDTYLARLSRNRRQKLRSLWRKNFDSGNAIIRRADCTETLQRGWDILIELHERRRSSIGDSGCFSQQQFTSFLYEAAQRMHERGMLRLQWIEIEGTPAAVDFSLSDDRCVYGYQCGINPDFAKHRPGTLMMVANFRQAIADGFREFDFLRGDEEYKTHWAAEQRPSLRIRIVPPRAIARTKHGLWLGGTTVKQWMKEGRQRVRQLRTAEA